MSWLFESGGQSIASASVLPMNIQDWSPLELTGLISLQSKGLSRVLQHHSSKASVLQHLAVFMVQLSHPYRTTGKIIVFLFNTLSRFVIAFLPRNRHLLISLLQSPSAVIWEPKKIKLVTAFHFFPFYLPWSDGTTYHNLSFLNVEF